tara:strand:+ start:2073 stop:2597 length:525 start_codon:yes stop_codon:yes gene_type:complete
MNKAKVTAIKNLVNTVSGVNVDSRFKTDELVKARAMCYKIMRDDCFMTYTFIAKSFNKNHATIIHALKEFEWMIKFDKNMERMFVNIMNKWRQERADYEELSPFELKKQLNNLAEQNKMLNLSLINVQEQCEEVAKFTKKYSKIVSLIEKRNLPEQKLKEVETKLNHVLNGLQV